MIRKTITFTDIDGNVVTDDFYFNLTEAEMLELQLSHKGGFQETLQYLISSDDQAGIFQAIKTVILAAYGERGENGRQFIKTKERAEAFSHTEAYSNLFMELGTNAKNAAEFMTGLMPAKVQEKLREDGDIKVPQDHKPSEKIVEIPFEPEVKTPQEPEKTEFKTISPLEARNMPQEELVDFLAKGGKVLNV